MEKKECISCGKEKPLEEFYKHPATADRRGTKCKQCTKTYQKKRRAKMKEEDEKGYLEYFRQKGKEHRNRMIEKYKNNLRNGETRPGETEESGT